MDFPVTFVKLDIFYASLSFQYNIKRSMTGIVQEILVWWW